MKIEIRLFASLARHMPVRGVGEPAAILEVNEGATLEDVLRRLKVPLEAVKVVFLNGVHAGLDRVLKEGDRVGVFPPVAGG